MKLKGEPRRLLVRSGEAVGASEEMRNYFDPKRDLSPDRIASVNHFLDEMEGKLEGNKFDGRLLENLSILIAWQFVDPTKTNHLLASLDRAIEKNWDQVVVMFKNESKRGRPPHSWSMLENVFIYLCHLLPHRTTDFRQALKAHEGDLQIPDQVTKELCALLLNPERKGSFSHSSDQFGGMTRGDRSLPDWKAFARKVTRGILVDPSLLREIPVDSADKEALLRSLGRRFGGHSLEHEGWIITALIFLSADEVTMSDDGFIQVSRVDKYKRSPSLPSREV